MTVERDPARRRARDGRRRSHHRRQDDHRAHAHRPPPVMVADPVAEASATRTTPAARGRGPPPLAVGRAGPRGRHHRRLPARPAHLRGLAARPGPGARRGDRGGPRRRSSPTLRARELAPASVARTMVPVRALHRFLADEGRTPDRPRRPPRAAAGARRASRRPSPRRRSAGCSTPRSATVRRCCATGPCSRCSTAPASGCRSWSG